MADIGYAAIILALILSLYSVAALILGASKGNIRLTSSGRKGTFLVCGLVSLAAYLLYYALLSHDFSLKYVYSHTSRDMPLLYNISAFWAGNAGSLLFLAWILSFITVVIIIRKRNRDEKFTAYTLAIITGTLAFLLLLLVFTASPFEKHGHSVSDGIGLNPILENPGMVIHPPLLLAGYILFTVPFALAIAALILKKRDSQWLTEARTWALLAWLLLGVGNLIGAWWAYVELGWGGYWAWDPVENAGLMPWLIGTAFLHSANVHIKTGKLKLWTIALISLTFNFCVFGMFLNRSDFLSSVHNYTGTGMEPFFLVFMGISFLGPLSLICLRRNYFSDNNKEQTIISKENSFVLTNILFILSTFVILLGTILPWISEKSGSSTTVEASFFNKSVLPMIITIIFLAGICILLGWRKASIKRLFRKIIFPLALSLILCLILYLVDIREWYALTLFPLLSFVIITHLLDLYRKLRTRNRSLHGNLLKFFAGGFRSNRSYYGGMIIHLGITFIAIGVIGSSFYQSEGKAGLQPGDSMTIDNYTLTYEEMSVKDASDRIIFTAILSVYDGDKFVGVAKPEKSIYLNTGQLVSEVDIRSMPHWWFPTEDLYVILAGQAEDGTASLQVLINPLVDLIWIGGAVLTLGGILAFWPVGTKKAAAQITGTMGIEPEKDAI